MPPSEVGWHESRADYVLLILITMSWHLRAHRLALTLLILGCIQELNFFSPKLKSESPKRAGPAESRRLQASPMNARSWNPSMDAASGLRKSLQAYFRPQDIGAREMKATFKSALLAE